jgi:hypothetical protein
VPNFLIPESRLYKKISEGPTSGEEDISPRYGSEAYCKFNLLPNLWAAQVGNSALLEPSGNISYLGKTRKLTGLELGFIHLSVQLSLAQKGCDYRKID